MPQAARIPHAIWEQHREEIIAKYTSGDLPQTMAYMGEKYGFQATKNQYTGKLESWGIKKYNSGTDWKLIARVTRKRKADGKESDVTMRGRKFTKAERDKEIARHVRTSEVWSTPGDDVLPDHIMVSTPPAETIAVPRGYLVRKLPSIQNARAILGVLGKSFLHVTICDALQFCTRTNDTCQAPNGINNDSAQSDDFSRLSLVGTVSHLARSRPDAYFSPGHIGALTSTTLALGARQQKSLSSDYEVLQQLVFWATNDLLSHWKFIRVCNWIRERIDGDKFLLLCRLRIPSMDGFTRTVFRAAVESGDVWLANRLIQCGAILHQGASPQGSPWTDHLSRAFNLGYDGIVSLLCNQGVPPMVNGASRWKADAWNSHLPVLQTLLGLGAHPETFLRGQKPGFPLISAAGSGSLPAVELLLNAGARPDTFLPGYYGTALQAASWGGHMDVVKCLIRYTADVNVPHEMVFDLSAEDSPIEAIVALQTPLQIAAKRNNIALVELLLEHGASALKCPVTAHAHVERVACGKMSGYLFNGEIHVPIYKEGGCIYTCLQYAAVNENLDMIRLLIAQGADPDSRVAPRVGDTPLQISARLGNVAIFHLLLESGASLDAPPGMCDGRTALQGAAESGNLEILLILQRLGGLATLIQAPASNELGMTALQAACLNGHRIFAALLLAFGAHVNEPPSPVAGLTAVQAAAWGGNTDLIRDLITLGACVDLPATGKGTTALLACMRHKSLPLLELIAQNDRNANLSRDWRFQTPLQRAVYCDWFAGVEVFLASGAKVNDLVMPARNREFKTLPGKKEFRPDTQSPLGRAITNGSETITDLLLQHEADVLTPVELEYDGRIPQSALRHAIGQDSDIEIINLLLAKVPELERHSGWEDAIKLTLPHDNGYVTRLMIEKVSAMPPPLRLKGIQPAWDSLPEEAYGDLSLDECVRLLVEGGASVNSQAEDGSTILQRISEDGWLDTWRFLIQHGATINVDATRSFGTPLQEAFKWEKADAANLLLENGADINALPALERGVTALQAAAINGMLEMATRLLESGADVAAPAAPVEGRTAIDGSAERGNWDMVQLLLNAYEARGLDPGPVCAQAAEYAGREGYDQLAKWLREYSPS